MRGSVVASTMPKRAGGECNSSALLKSTSRVRYVVGGVGWVVHGFFFELDDGTRHGVFLKDHPRGPVDLQDDAMLRLRSAVWNRLDDDEYVVAVRGTDSTFGYLAGRIDVTTSSHRTFTFTGSRPKLCAGEPFALTAPPDCEIVEVFFGNGACECASYRQISCRSPSDVASATDEGHCMYELEGKPASYACEDASPPMVRGSVKALEQSARSLRRRLAPLPPWRQCSELPSTPECVQSGASKSDFWSCPEEMQTWESPHHPGVRIRFRAALVTPTSTGSVACSTSDSDGGQRLLPIVFHFSALCDGEVWGGGLSVEDWAAVATEPYVFIAARRPAKHWWFINDASHWGWVQGSISRCMVQGFNAWMEEHIHHPRINRHRVCLFGFSAGAYAVTEILARHDTTPRHPFLGIGVGGVHGHGSCNLEAVPEKRRGLATEAFRAYLDRLRCHRGAKEIVAVHALTDKSCSWMDAKELIATISDGQEALGLPKVDIQLLGPDQLDGKPSAKRNANHHCYFKAAFLRREFFQQLLGSATQE
eukprot:TRINITY_DN8325_c1_g1_i2.p1 TRINITY_DN8325_c1_g1~~TRINITY_DN8325_c1_g1_i2.p1  ORF type:complete len:535 (-),score=58.81 TRINITY_DN8325_c1_g1_i2:199-1803(-)